MALFSKTFRLAEILYWVLVAIFVAILGVQIANAAPEAFCPGGASPRSDIVWCAGFDDLDQCTTGQEAGCVTDSGLSSLSSTHTEDFKIKTCPYTPPISTSTGCIYGSGRASGTGPGYSNKTISPTVTSACLRYYVLFGEGYLQNVSDTGNHGPGIFWDDGSSCSGVVTIDFTLSSPRAALQVNGSTCGGDDVTTFNPTTVNIAKTGTDWIPKNEQWYRIDECITLNTTNSSATVGNGTLTVKVDGVTLISRTNLNFRGPSTTAKVDEIYAARSFVGLGVPSWEPNIYFSGFAFSNDGTEIGASASEGSMGTGDTSSPYWYNIAGNGAEQMKLASDCSAPAGTTDYVTGGWDDDYGTAPSYVTSPDHNGYPCDASCVGCTTSNAMKAETTGSGQRAGVQHYVSNLDSTINNSIVAHGWVYWPTGNSYASTVPVMGMSRYCAGGGGGVDRCVLGVGRDSNGKAALVIYTDNVAGTTITSTANLSLDTWHEIQVAVDDSNKVYLQVDGSWVIDGQTPSQSISTWAFDDVSAGNQLMVFGIMRDSPATTYTVYYDDMDAGAASFNDTKFWGTSSPFTAASTGGTTRRGYLLNLFKRKRR